MNAPFFELRGISKYFSRVVANHNVSFAIERGQVLALLSENGAGKSTIMKILYGLYQEDAGEILMDGEKKRIQSPKEAIALGISMIQQHFSLVMAHTVTENVILGHVKGIIDRRAAEEKIGRLSQRYGFGIDPHAVVGRLSVGEQQKVEILKALYLDAKLLIMDEPTAVLTPAEADTLMRFVKDFTKAGNAVVFITHKLKEVMAVADRIVVMRSGEVCGNLSRDDANEKELARLMIGHDLIPVEAPEQPEVPGEICLELKNACVGPEKGPPPWITSASRSAGAKCWALPAWLATASRNCARRFWAAGRSAPALSSWTARISGRCLYSSASAWASAMCLATATATVWSWL